MAGEKDVQEKIPTVMNSAKKFLFLYSELADYFLACLKALQQTGNAEIHVVHWPVNPEAPFKFSFPDGVKFYSRENYTTEQLIKLAEEINPNLIFCSGWMDKPYLKICRRFSNKIPVVVGFDNHWTGSLKQRIAVAASPFTIQRYFTHSFIPGEPQKKYAIKLGFAEAKILTGFYSADYNKFLALGKKHREQKLKSFPKRFIYVGRYVEHKGIKDLWQAFIELQSEQANEWELWCLGTGPLLSEAVEHPKIKHFGFVQPLEMEKFIAQSGVFVLPSHFEPWGVVVHEFAAAGFPLVLSDKVGASTQFLIPGMNGFTFNSGNVSQLKEALKFVSNLSDEQLLGMGEKSVQLAQTITPQSWAEKLRNLIDNN
jgi:glycosyltransferase involved in cell wall biosynthesis